MNFLPLVFWGFTLLSIGLFHRSLGRILAKRRKEHIRLTQGRRPRRFHYSIVRLVLLGVLAVGSTSTLVAYCSYTLLTEHRIFSLSEESDPHSEKAKNIGSPNVTQPLKSTKELFPEFHLSEVKNSKLFVLTNLMIKGDPITFSLVSDAKYRFEEFLERNTHPVTFFQYYKNVNDFFPMEIRLNMPLTMSKTGRIATHSYVAQEGN